MSLDFFSILGRMLGFLRLLAAQTATKVDDECVDLLQAIHDDPTLRGWFGDVIDAAPADGTLSLTAAPAPEVLAVLEARGVKWERLLELLPTLIALFRAFAGK